MRTTPINDTLIQLTRMGFVNAYLVREDDGFTLVDTTMAEVRRCAAGGRPRRRRAHPEDRAHPRPRRPRRLAR